MACMHIKTFDIYHNDQCLIPDDYIEIDELIAPAMQALNRKGYLTKWCCSGHPLKNWLMRTGEGKHEKSFVSPNSYIAFKDGIFLPTMPPEYVMNLSWNLENVIIRKSYSGDDFFEVSQNILETMKQLYEWALSLPEYSSADKLITVEKRDIDDETMKIMEERIKSHGLEMEVPNAKYISYGGNNQIICYYNYTAERNIDTSELVKDLADILKMKIEFWEA